MNRKSGRQRVVRSFLAGALILEERALLSTIIVTNPTDKPVAGEMDLRQAVTAAEASGGSNVIEFAVNGPVIDLTQGPLSITAGNGIQIQGFPAAGGNLEIDGGGLQIFQVQAGATLVLGTLTLTDFGTSSAISAVGSGATVRESDTSTVGIGSSPTGIAALLESGGTFISGGANTYSNLNIGLDVLSAGVLQDNPFAPGTPVDLFQNDTRGIYDGVNAAPSTVWSADFSGDTTGMTVDSQITVDASTWLDDKQALSIDESTGSIDTFNTATIIGCGATSSSSNTPAISVSNPSSARLIFNGLSASNNLGSFLTDQGGAALTVENALITGTTVDSGSPITVSGVTNTTIQGVTLSDNTFAGGVGTVYWVGNPNDTVTLYDVDVVGNVANSGGGGFAWAAGLSFGEDATSDKIYLNQVYLVNNTNNGGEAGALALDMDSGAPPAQLSNIAVVSNTSNTMAGMPGTGGVRATTGAGGVAADLYNSFFYANVGSKGSGDLQGAYASAYDDVYTIGTVSPPTGFTGVKTNLIGVNPDVSPFGVYLPNPLYATANLGSMLLEKGSPLIGLGSQVYTAAQFQGAPDISNLVRPVPDDMGPTVEVLSTPTPTPTPTPTKGSSGAASVVTVAGVSMSSSGGKTTADIYFAGTLTSTPTPVSSASTTTTSRKGSSIGPSFTVSVGSSALLPKGPARQAVVAQSVSSSVLGFRFTDVA